MKNTFSKITLTFVVVSSLLYVNCKKNANLEANNYLPLDVMKTCTLSPSDFDSWFATGKVSENGLVNPANSVTFPSNNNCDFYKWSEQMFLWITSPVASGTVLESPTFYNVSPPYNISPENPFGIRDLIPHTPNTLMKATGNINQNGPNKLPIFLDKKGRMFEIENLKDTQNAQVKNSKNELITVHQLVKNTNGSHDLLDEKGKIIEQPKANIKSTINPSRIVHQIKIGNKKIYLDNCGNQIESEEGQAGSSGALVTGKNSLVYYITMVNDVYAYFLSAANEGKINASQFPTTQLELDNILAYAKAKGLTPPTDSNALAMELKTSWVEASSVTNSENYVTIKAIIPTYDKSNPNKWIINGETTTTLALVGMHIVGSVAGHPEMIWATFEHQDNSPNSAYSYKDLNNNTKTVKADTNGSWLFNNNPSDTLSVPNIQNRTVGKYGDTITIKDSKITNPGVRRIMAWGSASNTVPNQENKTPADANSELISINNDIQKMLVGNDIRKNYLLIGATWTLNGTAPNGVCYPYGTSKNDSIPSVVPKGDAIGTAQLSNSTMETFVQSPSSASTYSNSISCFSCHNNNNGLAPSDLSHVFGEIKTILPIPLKSKK